MAARPPLAPWKRALRFVVVGTLEVALWGAALTMLVTGIVTWRDWHALADRGVDHTAAVTDCEWESMEGKHRLTSSRSSGYWSCHYAYRAPGDPAEHRGYFQSPREWRVGEPIAIRYRDDRPEVSATAQNLEDPKVLPAALIVLPFVYAAVRRRNRGRRPAAPVTAGPRHP